MTKEITDLIIDWFEHIQQMANDRKTLTGAVMDAQHCLNEIAAIACNSKQFVKEYRHEQESLDEEKLDKQIVDIIYSVFYDFQDGEKVSFNLLKEIAKACYRKAWEDKQ